MTIENTHFNPLHTPPASTPANEHLAKKINFGRKQLRADCQMMIGRDWSGAEVSAKFQMRQLIGNHAHHFTATFIRAHSHSSSPPRIARTTDPIADCLRAIFSSLSNTFIANIANHKNNGSATRLYSHSPPPLAIQTPPAIE